MSSVKLTKEIVNSRIIGRGIELVGEFITVKIKTHFQCKCGYKWLATPKNIMAGNGCPICSAKIVTDQKRLSKETVNERIMDRGIELVGEYTNSYSKAEFRCKCGHLWEATPNNIMSGKGCPVCANHGYNPGKPGWIYILIFANFIKYGITNNLKQRLGRHRLNGEYTVALSKLYEDGNTALNWERNIMIIFGGRFISKEIMPDGYTETLCISKLELLLDTVW